MIAALLLAAAPLVVPIPGRIVHAAPGADGILLLSEEGNQVRLYWVDAVKGGSVTPKKTLPKDTSWCGEVDLDGDGEAETVVAGGGGIFRIAGGEAHPWALDPDLGRVTSLRFHGGRFWTAVPRALVSYGPERTEEASLPARAERRGRQLHVTGPPLHDLLLSDGSLALAAGPVEADRRRLRTVLLRTPGPAVEAWSLLPEPEQVLESALLELGDAPFLVVTSVPAGKLELFGEKRLRVFPLEADRTRRGKPPLFAVTSRMNLWQRATFHAEDVDGDGRDDLAVRYVKGLKDLAPTVDVYLARAGGGFDPRPRTSEIAVEDADGNRAVYGADVDADGRADLVIAAGGRLLAYPGAGAGKEVVARRPALAAVLPDGFRDPGKQQVSVGTGGVVSGPVAGGYELLLRDLDGDARPEAILVGADRIAILRLEAIAADAR